LKTEEAIIFEHILNIYYMLVWYEHSLKVQLNRRISDITRTTPPINTSMVWQTKNSKILR
jgi:hypothetical protein